MTCISPGRRQEHRRLDMFTAKEYVRAESLEQAWSLNQKKSSAVLGGMMWLKMGNGRKGTIIDLSGLGLDTIQEDDREFSIGAMCTLRQLETHQGLNLAFDGVFRECVRHIVGVQFRNGATVGGSVFGRYGFSDVLTCLMALETEVELYRGGRVLLEKFAAMPYDRDILVRLWVKKDGRRAAYGSQRNTATDFPVIACAVSRLGDEWKVAVGARPKRAESILLDGRGKTAGQLAEEAAKAFSYGSNLRAGAAYHAHLAQVYIRRLAEKLGEES